MLLPCGMAANSLTEQRDGAPQLPVSLLNYRTDKLVDAISQSLSLSPPAPDASEIQGDTIMWTFDEHNSTESRIREFVSRWPPSHTPEAYCAWLGLDRGSHSIAPVTEAQIASLHASAAKIIAANEVTVESLDQIAAANGVTAGRWLIFSSREEIDELWYRILCLVCLKRQKGLVRVSPQKVADHHVVYVYAEDFTDMQELISLREDLRSIGISWKIGFKLDAYTHLGIYGRNDWNIRPNRYFE
ncbi:translation initiation factor eIF 4e-like domain-containing protein [Mycena floridula]|nr:translation initiation factor eIF 4e-like domain-containing protein [Mycena floridula]